MKTKSFLSLCSLAGFIVLTFVGLDSCKKTDEDINIHDSTFSQKVEVILQNQITQNDVAGIAMYTKNTKGAEAWVAAGLADIDNNIPVKNDTKFRVASISKSILAVVVLQLMEEENFAIEDKFSDYLPDSLVSLFPYGNDITIFQLLGHTSGLYDFEDEQFIGMLLENTTYHWTPWELLEYSVEADSAVFFPPGTEYHYSNTNYIILGLLVEKVSGISMEMNIRNRIFTPLNLSNSYCGGLEVVPQDNYAVGYVPTPLGEPFTVTDQTLPLYFEWGHGEIISTVYELSLFFEALSKNELFQHQSTLDAMLNWSKLSQNTYGLGISNFPLNLGYGHDGSTAGFYSFATINPDDGAVIIFCFNQYSTTIMDAVISDISEIINN